MDHYYLCEEGSCGHDHALEERRNEEMDKRLFETQLVPEKDEYGDVKWISTRSRQS